MMRVLGVGLLAVASVALSASVPVAAAPPGHVDDADTPSARAGELEFLFDCRSVPWPCTGAITRALADLPRGQAPAGQEFSRLDLALECAAEALRAPTRKPENTKVISQMGVGHCRARSIRTSPHAMT